MNSSSYHPLPVIELSPAVELLGQQFVKALAYLFVPTELLYFSIYFHVKGHNRIFGILNFVSIAAFWLSPHVAPISCGPARCLQNFAIAIGTMKLLDLWVRRNAMRKYTAGKQLPDWLLALIMMTELRYESFTPNHIRVPKSEEKFNEPMQLAIHVGIFTVLQALPQNINLVLAFEVQLAIYIIWTSMQLLLRYKTSPALFGPLYKADSLTSFWSETWHNAFASPCMSLAYAPVRFGLAKAGVPLLFARGFGVLAAFTLMAVFHIYALYPILDSEGLFRLGTFFILNGVATVTETAIWGQKRHWLKTTLAWIFQAFLGSWTAAGLNIPHGLSKMRWREMCDAPTY